MDKPVTFFTIKKLGSDDIALAKELFYFFQIDDGIAYPIIPSNEYLHSLLQKDDFHVIIAIVDHTLIGGLTAYELDMYKEEIKEMFLYEIAVEPEQRKRGVAKALIGHLKDISIAKGIKEMYVGTSTDNHAAMKLYRSTGGEADTKIAWFVYTLRC
jgi:aminoglycoside 3-N-acetyltransferase I